MVNTACCFFNQEVVWENNQRCLHFTSLRILCFDPIKFYIALLRSNTGKDSIHWHSAKLRQIAAITGWTLMDISIMKICETIDLICENPTATSFINDFTGRQHTEISDMRRWYKRCYAVHLTYIAPNPNDVRKKGGNADPAMEIMIKFLTKELGLSTEFFDMVRWNKRAKAQKMVFEASNLCRWYVCDHALFDAPKLCLCYDIKKDEYNISIPGLGYTVHCPPWKINEQQYSNIVGTKPYESKLEPIKEEVPRVPLPQDPQSWPDLAMNDDVQWIPCYLDVSAIISSRYGFNKPVLARQPTDMNDDN